jgi:hypothetical protein
MTKIQEEIVALLARQAYATSFVDPHGNMALNPYTTSARVDLDVQWVTDALTLLLRIELERQA